MTVKLALALLFPAAAALCQTAPSFEVASVKPSAPLTSLGGAGKVAVRLGMTMDAGRVDCSMMTLADLIQRAYEVKPYQVTGPDWLTSERYDIHAKLPEGAGTDQVPAMLQSLLAERFKLTLHRDHKDHSVYALVLGKNFKLPEVEPDPTPARNQSGDSAPNKAATEFRATVSAGGAAAGAADGGKVKVMVRDDGGKATVSNSPSIHLDRKMTMSALADFLGRMVDKPVIDMTEKPGTYQIAMDIPIQALLQAKGANVVINGVAGGGDALHGLGGDTASDPSGSAIFTSIQQLGLRLDSRKAPMEMLVVDRAEKVPTEN